MVYFLPYSGNLREENSSNMASCVSHIAIPKPRKDHSDAAYYRPISLLSVGFKCLERLILQRIKSEENTADEQAGFRSGRSTCHQVLALFSLI